MLRQTPRRCVSIALLGKSRRRNARGFEGSEAASRTPALLFRFNHVETKSVGYPIRGGLNSIKTDHSARSSEPVNSRQAEVLTRNANHRLTQHAPPTPYCRFAFRLRRPVATCAIRRQHHVRDSQRPRVR